MKLKIAVLSGDGIGPEVTLEAVKILKAIARKFDHKFIFEEALVGAIAIKETGKPLPSVSLNLCKKSDAILFGAIGDPYYDNNPNEKVRPEQGLLKLRKACNLFLNIRPVETYKQLLDQSPIKNDIVDGADFSIFRELTGGLYFGEKKLSKTGDEASDLCSYKKTEIERVTHLAFKAAQKSKGKVTLVDKANVLETSRLWRRVVFEVAEKYRDVKLEFLYVDNAAMQLILNPKQFDIILTENLFGDILSDQASAITGSIGMMPSASIGDKHCMFEPIHGSYPQAKGKGIANPLASILSAAMLLDHFELIEEAAAIRHAVKKSLDWKVSTPDLVKDAQFSTSMVGDFIESIVEDAETGIINENAVELGHTTII